MAEVRENLKYSKSHEWVRVEDGVATIGISDYAQAELTDIVYVELPKVGDDLEVDDEFGVVESVKSVSELLMPVSGEVIEVNSELEDSPEIVNESPYDKGWMIKVKMDEGWEDEVEELLTPNAYLSQTD